MMILEKSNGHNFHIVLLKLNSKRSIRMSDAKELQLSKIGQIAINVKNVERAEAFYKDKLKMKHLFSFPGLAFFDCDGTRLMLGLPEKPEFDHPSSVLYFKVEDIQGSYQTFRDRGV